MKKKKATWPSIKVSSHSQARGYQARLRTCVCKDDIRNSFKALGEVGFDCSIGRTLPLPGLPIPTPIMVIKTAAMMEMKLTIAI
jgi:hypothetical protein